MLMLTSVTSSPHMRSTVVITLRRTAAARSGMATPYSTTASISAAACRSPTSTATPRLSLTRVPGRRSRTAPAMRAAPAPIAYTPSTSRVATATIFATTASAIVVRPCSLTSAVARPGCPSRATPVLGLAVVVSLAGVLTSGLPPRRCLPGVPAASARHRHSRRPRQQALLEDAPPAPDVTGPPMCPASHSVGLPPMARTGACAMRWPRGSAALLLLPGLEPSMPGRGEAMPHPARKQHQPAAGSTQQATAAAPSGMTAARPSP